MEYTTWAEIKTDTKNTVRWRILVEALCSAAEWWGSINQILTILTSRPKFQINAHFTHSIHKKISWASRMTLLTCTKMLACLQLLYVRLSSRYCPAILHHLKIVLLLGLFPWRLKFSDARRLLNAANTARGRGSVISFKHSGSVSTLAYRRSACESSPSNQYAATPTTPDHQWASSSSEPVTQERLDGKLYLLITPQTVSN